MKYGKEFIGTPFRNITSNGDTISNYKISFVKGGDYYIISNAINAYLRHLDDELRASKGELLWVTYMFTDKIIVLELGVKDECYADVIDLEGRSIWGDMLQVLEKIPEEMALKYFYDNNSLLSLSGLDYLYRITRSFKNKSWDYIPENLKSYICKV